jgi:hypothetical protein
LKIAKICKIVYETNKIVEFIGGLGMRKFFALSILFLSLMGCSKDSAFQGFADDSSRKATISDAQIALDNQDYDSVIADLIGMYHTTDPDPEISRLLGSAYMGKAGIDTTNVITFDGTPDYDLGADALTLAIEAVTNDTFTDETACNADTLVVLMTTSDGQYIDGHCVGDIITYVDKAKRVFELLDIYNINTPEDTIQCGIAAAAHYVLIMGNGTANALNVSLTTDDPVTGQVPAPINKKSYNLMRYHNPWDRNYYTNWSRVSTHAFFIPVPLSTYHTDLNMVNNAVNAITTQSPVRDNLDDFLREILQKPTGTIDENTISELTSLGIFDYINNQLVKE